MVKRQEMMLQVNASIPTSRQVDIPMKYVEGAMTTKAVVYKTTDNPELEVEDNSYEINEREQLNRMEKIG